MMLQIVWIDNNELQTYYGNIIPNCVQSRRTTSRPRETSGKNRKEYLYIYIYHRCGGNCTSKIGNANRSVTATHRSTVS